MTGAQSFESTTEGRRRSVLFAIGVLTGFISVVAAVSAYGSSPENLPITLVLAAVGVIAFAFAVLVFIGRFQGLVESDQVFWSNSE